MPPLKEGASLCGVAAAAAAAAAQLVRNTEEEATPDFRSKKRVCLKAELERGFHHFPAQRHLISGARQILFAG